MLIGGKKKPVAGLLEQLTRKEPYRFTRCNGRLLLLLKRKRRGSTLRYMLPLNTGWKENAREERWETERT